MLESTPEHGHKEFVTLMRHYAETPTALVKGELYPSLLAKVKTIIVDENTCSHTLLHMLLDL
jgi:hypothetical protein